MIKVILAQLLSLHGFVSSTGFYWEIQYRIGEKDFSTKLPFNQPIVKIDERRFTEEQFDPDKKTVYLSFTRLNQ